MGRRGGEEKKSIENYKTMVQVGKRYIYCLLVLRFGVVNIIRLFIIASNNVSVLENLSSSESDKSDNFQSGNNQQIPNNESSSEPIEKEEQKVSIQLLGSVISA
ncbi:unnamed protein product [Hermetia illucens]|uniref:Uncharacterized protein n=1 Tax=Hermetia illucens TaxID=343691 RepID=A0A7R8Z2I4_HERIL|nr:unnamed protein product [Hermetia illucens]